MKNEASKLAKDGYLFWKSDKYKTKDEMIEILYRLNKNVKLIDYFETLPSTKRSAKDIIWGNFIIKKFENKNQ